MNNAGDAPAHADAPAQEIVIVRRRGGRGDEGHHGGVWKIAYADFMTAMMAFFLVMWLVNASNEEIKAGVASYFNPMRLSEAVPSSRGINDANGKPRAGSRGADGTTESVPTGDGVDVSSGGRDGMETKSPADGSDSKADGGIIADDTVGKATPSEETMAALRGLGGETIPRINPFATLGPGQDSDDRSAETRQRNEDLSTKARPDEADGAASPVTSLVLPAPGTKGSDAGTGGPAPSQTGPGETLRREADKLATEIKKAIGGIATKDAPNVSVEVEAGLLVVTLTDKANFGMFEIGSAKPSPKLTAFVKKLMPVLNARSEKVIVRGHTDAQPFTSTSYDNWRLSIDRAVAAYAMLLGMGIERSRFARIEGYAESKLRDPNAPNSAVNRRIEIVLQK